MDGYSYDDEYDDDDDNETLTRAQVEACLLIVQDYIDRTEGHGWEVAVHPPGHEGRHWVASLECQTNWPYAISERGVIAWPDGVAVGAVNHFALSLHPA